MEQPAPVDPLEAIFYRGMPSPNTPSDQSHVAHRFLRSQRNPYEPEEPKAPEPEGPYAPQVGDVVRLSPEYIEERCTLKGIAKYDKILAGEHGKVMKRYDPEGTILIQFPSVEAVFLPQDLQLVRKATAQKNPYEGMWPEAPVEHGGPKGLYIPELGDVVKLMDNVLELSPDESIVRKEFLRDHIGMVGTVYDNAPLGQVMVEFADGSILSVPCAALEKQEWPRRAQKNPYENIWPEEPVKPRPELGGIEKGDVVVLRAGVADKYSASLSPNHDMLQHLYGLKGSVTKVYSNQTGVEVKFPGPSFEGYTVALEPNDLLLKSRGLWTTAQKNPYENIWPEEPIEPKPQKFPVQEIQSTPSGHELAEDMDAARSNGNPPQLIRIFSQDGTLEIQCHEDELGAFERESGIKINTDTPEKDEFVALCRYLSENCELLPDAPAAPRAAQKNPYDTTLGEDVNPRVGDIVRLRKDCWKRSVPASAYEDSYGLDGTVVHVDVLRDGYTSALVRFPNDSITLNVNDVQVVSRPKGATAQKNPFENMWEDENSKENFENPLPHPDNPHHVENLNSLDLLQRQGFHGSDASLATSLFEYGLAWRDLGTETLFIYSIGNGEFERATMANNMDMAKEYSWAKIPAVTSSAGMDEATWNALPLPHKIMDMVSYYGVEEIFGTSYHGGFKIAAPLDPPIRSHTAQKNPYDTTPPPSQKPKEKRPWTTWYTQEGGRLFLEDDPDGNGNIRGKPEGLREIFNQFADTKIVLAQDELDEFERSSGMEAKDEGQGAQTKEFFDALFAWLKENVVMSTDPSKFKS